MPDISNLKVLSNLFNVTLDSLLHDVEDVVTTDEGFCCALQNMLILTHHRIDNVLYIGMALGCAFFVALCKSLFVKWRIIAMSNQENALAQKFTIFTLLRQHDWQCCIAGR